MFARVFGGFVAVFATVALMSASGAASAQVQRGLMIDVSTRTAVGDYLRSIHIDPRGAVIQRGVRNYAGANCPGSGWTCTTTRNPVVQIASAGGSNTFRCSTANCAVVQIAAPRVITTNIATCIKTTGLSQTCTISQSGADADNRAIVYERITNSTATPHVGAITQSATATVSITQMATGPGNAPNSNQACVYQEIALDRSGNFGSIQESTLTHTQSAHQTVTIKQDSANGGNSAAQSATQALACTGGSITQRQTLSSTLTFPRAITQKQNALTRTANVTVDIEQNQSQGFFGIASGQNAADFNQFTSLKAVANSAAGAVTQTQSYLLGGLLGTVNQDSRDLSVASTTQTEVQCEDAATSGLTTCDPGANAGVAPAVLKQTQYGPVRKGVGTATQSGNGANSFAVEQLSTQDTDQGSGSHQTNVLQGDCSTTGFCTVSQVATINGHQSSNTQSGRDVNTTFKCKDSTCAVVQPAAGSGGGGLPARIL